MRNKLKLEGQWSGNHRQENINKNSETLKKIFGPTQQYGGVKWLIFKVKKRAKNNFNAVVGNDPSVPIQYNAASDSLTSGFTRKDLGAAVNHFTYSYNWPHDFFSLVELAKIDSITTFNPIYGTSELENFEKEDSE